MLVTMLGMRMAVEADVDEGKVEEGSRGEEVEEGGEGEGREVLDCHSESGGPR